MAGGRVGWLGDGLSRRRVVDGCRVVVGEGRARTGVMRVDDSHVYVFLDAAASINIAVVRRHHCRH